MAHTIFTNQVPAILDINATEGQPGVTLGTTWYSEHDGVIRGIRFYLGNRNYDGAQVTGVIFDWDDHSTLIQQSYTISAADSIGFVTIPLAINQQLLVTRNKRYITAVYFPCDTSPDGKAHYVASGSFFTPDGLDNPPLHAMKDDRILDRRNGTYSYGSTLAFPSGSFNSGCYFVDVVFDYVAKMPVLDETTGTYKQYVVKYREGGVWKY